MNNSPAAIKAAIAINAISQTRFMLDNLQQLLCNAKSASVKTTREKLGANASG
jgi:hypothetical protein